MRKKKKTPKRRTDVPFRQLQIEYVPISALKEWKKNPRRNDDAAERLAGLMEQHGFIVPVIATRDGTIRAGHTRYKSAKLKGMKKVPVIYVDFDSEEDAELFSISDNRSHEWSEWDQDMLRTVFGELLEAHPDKAPRMAGLTHIEIEGLRISDSAPDTLQEAIKEFEREVSDAGLEDEWVWVMVPDADTVALLAKRFGNPKAKGAAKRELSWERVRKLLLSAKRKKST